MGVIGTTFVAMLVCGAIAVGGFLLNNRENASNSGGVLIFGVFTVFALCLLLLFVVLVIGSSIA